MILPWCSVSRNVWVLHGRVSRQAKVSKRALWSSESAAYLSKNESANRAQAAKASGKATCQRRSFVAFEWYAFPRITAAAMPKGMAVNRATTALFLAPPACPTLFTQDVDT